MKDMDWHNMRTRLEALYVLDNALTGSSEEGLRLVQKKEIDSNLNYVVEMDESFFSERKGENNLLSLV